MYPRVSLKDVRLNVRLSPFFPPFFPPAHGDIAHTEPRFLPDGRHFIYLRDLAGDAGIWPGSLDVKPGEQDSRRLVQADLGGTYAPSSDPGFGHLLFLRGHTLMAQPFDARHLKIFGEPIRVVEEPVVQYWDAGALSVSANGTLAYRPGSMESQLTWFDAQGKIVGTVGGPGPYISLALSRDGTRALVSKSDPDSIHSLIHSLWLVDILRGTSARVDLDPLKDGVNGVWAPDGRGIIFGSTRAGHLSDIFEKQMGGAADPEALITSNEDKYPLSVSPDWHFLLYVRVGGCRQINCGCFRFKAAGSRCRCFGRSLMRLTPVFLPMGAGSRTYRTNRAV
jgi:eukaryotic-like serine/threonine-protein kinase